jgi:hypothetical protein
LAKAGADRKAAANALGDRHDVGGDAGPFMGEELAGAPDTALHFIEQQQDPMLVADLTQALEFLGRHRTHAAFALDRLDEDAGRRLADGGEERLLIAEGNLIEAVDLGAEAFDIFRLAAGGDGGKGAAMEGAVEGDDAVAFRMSLMRMVLARHLDRAFECFGARIGEEDGVGESCLGEALRQLLLARDHIDVGGVPDLLGLLGQRLDEMRMRMAEAGHGDARTEIEILLALFRIDAHALAMVEGERCTSIGRQHWRDHREAQTKMPPRMAAPRISHAYMCSLREGQSRCHCARFSTRLCETRHLSQTAAWTADSRAC